MKSARGGGGSGLVGTGGDGQAGEVIAAIHFRNFKALRDAQLALQPFNLVIGPNGSGKTSLIQAVLRLCSLARLPLASGDKVVRPGWAEIAFEFMPPFEGVRARLGCVSDALCDLLRVETTKPEDWEQLKGALRRVRSFWFDHQALAAPAKCAESELAVDGRNLAAVLWRRREREPEAFARLEREMLRLMPEFAALGFAQPDAEHVEIEFELAGEAAGHRVTAENLSQGTLYLLAILTLALDPAPPPIVCLEEIDRGIHPRMLREVRDALYRLTYPEAMGEARAPVQVIATTHSPYLLDLFREHPEEVVIAQKHGTAAHFERLADRQDIPELLQEGSLGDVWFSGILGGVPEGA